MKWTPKQEQKLRALWERGLTGAQVAKRMGISRSAAIAKYARIRGVVYQSDIERGIVSHAEAEKRRLKKAERELRQVHKLKAALSKGRSIHDAVIAARANGATFATIGKVLGVTRQAIHNRVSYRA